MSIIGVDTGGTFTDCVMIDDAGRITYGKAFSTPGDYSDGVIQSVANTAQAAGTSTEALLKQARFLAYGTTAGLNTLVTRAGPRVGLITTKGHEDAILIGRVQQKVAGLGEKERTYAVKMDKPLPLVPRTMIRGLNERVNWRGDVVVALDAAEIRRAAGELVEAGAEAIAVCFLWSFMNPAHEQEAGRVIGKHHPKLFVSLSSEVVPVIKEYERTATTVINAYVGPMMGRYLKALDQKLRARGLHNPFFIMQSAGGILPAQEAAARGVNTLSSGPVGGVIASQLLGGLLGYKNVIATDVGGTSFDVGLVVDGKAPMARAAVYDQYEILAPMVDITSIGAGGGSIAWVEPLTRTLRVGPKSAGASPGPACYGRGGRVPTVTDADLVLGRIDPDYFFGGRAKLSRELAVQAIEEHVARPMGMDVIDAAMGIVDIIDAHMADLVRRVTIERGYDPREFVLFAYGGGGPTHVGAYGRDLGSKAAVISPYAPVFSAFGIAASDVLRLYLKSSPLRLPAPAGEINRIFGELEQQARNDLKEKKSEARFARSMEMRFHYQTHEIEVPVPDGALTDAGLDAVMRKFEQLYEQSYGKGTGYRQAGIEVSTFRLTATLAMPKPRLARQPLAGEDAAAAKKRERPVVFDRRSRFIATAIYDAERLRPGNRIAGPAVVESPATTTIVHPGQRVRVDEYMNLILEFGAGAQP
jgi:N-methylhydantoinase A